jgi:hypothetical protein
MVYSKYVLSVFLSVSLIAGCGSSANENVGSASEQEISVAEETLANYATASEVEALGLGKTPPKKTLGQKADQKIAHNAQQAAARSKRAANIQKAISDLRAARALPHAKVAEANAKCAAISSAVVFLKSTNDPKRPFDGLRKGFRKALRDEKQKALAKVGVVSCGKLKNIAAQLPPSAPVPATPADEFVAESDPLDEVVLAPGE